MVLPPLNQPELRTQCYRLNSMVLESRAGRFAALAAVLIAVWSMPLVRQNLARLFFSPAYNDSGLVTIDRDTIHHNSGYGTVRPYVMDAWRKKSQSFTSLLPLERWTSPEGVHTERISEGLLESIGVQPWRGRMLHFSPDYEALASYEFTHGDPAWIGRTIQLRFRPYRITGIMPPRFRLLSRESEFWIAIPTDAKNLEFIGRLKPGVTPAIAQAELRKISRDARHWGTQKLEVITLKYNRQDALWFSLAILQWNLLFVAFLALRGWYNFLQSDIRKISKLHQARFLGFLLLKTAVLLLPFVLLWILFVDPEVQQYLSALAGWSVPVFFWIFTLAAWGLTFWSLNDQRNRCRTCLRHLRMPVNRGSYSSLVIDRPATESICLFGHGTLYVPGTHLLNLDSVNWTAHQDIWHELAI